MKYILLLAGFLAYQPLVNAGGLDAIVVPAKNMTEGGVFSDPEEVPALLGSTEIFEKVKKVFVPYFRVDYNKSLVGHSTAKGGSWNSNLQARVSAKVVTTGYSEEVFQKVTDQAYEDLISRLVEKGFEVISSNEAQTKSEAMQDKLSDWKEEYPNIDDETSVYVASGTTYPSGFFAALKPDNSLSMPPNDLNDELEAGIVSVGYSVNYVFMGSSVEEGVRKVSAELSLGPVVNVGGYFQMFDNGEQSRLDMGQVAYSEIPFGNLVNSTSTASELAQGAVSVLGIFMGSGSSGSFDDYTLTVDEEKFGVAMLDALKKANEGFVSAL